MNSGKSNGKDMEKDMATGSISNLNWSVIRLAIHFGGELDLGPFSQSSELRHFGVEFRELLLRVWGVGFRG